MRAYSSFFEFIFYNEMLFQMLLITLLCVPWRSPRNKFVLRGVAALALYGLPLFIRIPTPWYYLCVFVLTFLGIWLCFDRSARECLFHAVNAYCIQYIVSGVFYFLYWLFFVCGVYIQSPWIGLINVACTLLGCAVTAAVYLRRNLKQSQNERCINSALVLLITGAFLVMAVFISHYAERSIIMWNGEARMWLKAFSICCGSSMLIISVLNSRNYLLREDQNVLQLLLNKDKEQYELAKQSATDINVKYHDLKQRGEAAAFEGEMDELHLFSHYFTGNKALDIVLTEKADKCKKKAIRFICEAEGEIFNAMKSYHVYSMMSNCIENAIEGLSGVEEEKREIRISIKQKNQMGVVKIENYYDGGCEIVDGIPQTTKVDKDNHGYGVKSICAIAEKYGGNVRFVTENNLFEVLIAFPVVKQ